MTALVPFILVGWIPVVVLLFSVLRPRVAVATAFAAGWCFLPVALIAFPGFPDLTKSTATSLGVVLAMALFDGRRFWSFRPRWIDVPMALWCVVPMVSSLSNGLGAYDGASASFNNLAVWGVPYFVGRVYFTRVSHLRDLATPIIACALIYVPLCLYEVRMSPQLHTMLYGYFPHSFVQTRRFGGWRPNVFMAHGLQVGLWMGSAVALTSAVWMSGRVRAVRVLWSRVPLVVLVPVLAVTFVLVKSLGALVLSAGVIGVLGLVRVTKWSLPLAAVGLSCVLYMGVRATGVWSGEQAVQAAAVVSEARSASLAFRFEHERDLADHALQRPVFGWGGWGRNRVKDDAGRDVSVTDGLWVIVLGQRGLVGLASFYGAMLLPAVLVAMRCRPGVWVRRPEYALGAGVAAMVLINMADSLLNAMPLPIVTVATGALASCALRPGLGEGTGQRAMRRAGRVEGVAA